MRKKSKERSSGQNVDYLKILLRFSKINLQVYLSPSQMKLAQESITAIETAIREEDRIRVYENMHPLLKMMIETAEKQSIPMETPTCESFETYQLGKSLEDKVEFMVVLHSLFYLSLQNYVRQPHPDEGGNDE